MLIILFSSSSSQENKRCEIMVVLFFFLPVEFQWSSDGIFKKSYLVRKWTEGGKVGAFPTLGSFSSLVLSSLACVHLEAASREWSSSICFWILERHCLDIARGVRIPLSWVMWIGNEDLKLMLLSTWIGTPTKRLDCYQMKVQQFPNLED